MDAWQTAIAAVTAIIVALTPIGGAIRWWVGWRDKVRQAEAKDLAREADLAEARQEKQRLHEAAMAARFEKMQLEYLASLDRQEERCNKRQDDQQSKFDAIQEKRITDAKTYIEAMNAMVKTLPSPSASPSSTTAT